MKKQTKKSKIPLKFKKLFGGVSGRRTVLVLFVIIFASAGSVFLLRSNAATEPIKFYNFYPSDQCPYGAPAASNEVLFTQATYNRSNIQLNIKGVAICGLHPSGWYTQDNSISGIYYAFKAAAQSIGAGNLVDARGGWIFDNIRWELTQERGFKTDSPRVFFIRFNGWPVGTGGSHCGYTTPSPYHDQMMMSYVFTDNCMAAYGWSQNAIGAAGAHELGHIFTGDASQDRSTGDSNNLMWKDASVCGNRTSCYLDANQQAAIICYKSPRINGTCTGNGWASPKTK